MEMFRAAFPENLSMILKKISSTSFWSTSLCFCRFFGVKHPVAKKGHFHAKFGPILCHTFFWVSTETRFLKDCLFYTLLPSRHVLLHSQQWKYQSNEWNLFKVNNKDTSEASLKTERKPNSHHAFFSNSFKNGIGDKSGWTK